MTKGQEDTKWDATSKDAKLDQALRTLDGVETLQNALARAQAALNNAQSCNDPLAAQAHLNALETALDALESADRLRLPPALDRQIQLIRTQADFYFASKNTTQRY